MQHVLGVWPLFEHAQAVLWLDVASAPPDAIWQHHMVLLAVILLGFWWGVLLQFAGDAPALWQQQSPCCAAAATQVANCVLSWVALQGGLGCGLQVVCRVFGGQYASVLRPVAHLHHLLLFRALCIWPGLPITDWVVDQNRHC